MDVAILSDTHGLLRPEVVEGIQGIDHIIHAGDVGDPQILVALQKVAPVTAVRGNVDRGAWAEELPETATVLLGPHTFEVIHSLDDLAGDPAERGVRGVIFGHTHRPQQEERAGVMYLNPGSIGPRRFDLPISWMLMRIKGAEIETTFVEL